ncbi:hypothetical protein H6792_02280 [Candidatus Nomurabacteria bacterium]|nr:hypothetical protein [Candidatus Nomurabacteria bacterium]
MSRVFEASGPNGLVEAAEALLTTEEFDMAAISNVIDHSSTLLEELDDGSRQNDQINTERLGNELPQLHIVEGLVKTSWVKKGYRGMNIIDGFMLDQLRKPGIPPHVDELVYRDRRIEAGVQLSLCVKGLRKFMAERLPYDFRNEDGTFDASAYSEFYEFNGQLQSEIIAGRIPRIPRSEAMLRPGDVAMFPHHPAVTLHGATNVEPSIARLISYNAEKQTNN